MGEDRKLDTYKVYKAIIPSEISAVKFAVKETLQYIQNCSCIDESTLFELKVILNELIINAIKHGNSYDSSKSVKICAEFSAKGYVTISVEDEGEGYDFNCYKADSGEIYNVNEICEFPECGRGILIVRELCNSLRYNEKGNAVYVRKKITGD